MPSDVILVVSDGGMVGPKNPSREGATYAWVHVDAADLHVREDAGVIRPAHVDGDVVTNNQAEFLALLLCLEALLERWYGVVASDSNVTLGRFFRGWKMAGIPDRWAGRAEIAVRRLARRALMEGPHTIEQAQLIALRERVLIPVLLDGHPTRAQLRRGTGKRGNPVSKHNAWADEACSAVAARKEAIPCPA